MRRPLRVRHAGPRTATALQSWAFRVAGGMYCGLRPRTDAHPGSSPCVPIHGQIRTRHTRRRAHARRPWAAHAAQPGVHRHDDRTGEPPRGVADHRGEAAPGHRRAGLGRPQPDRRPAARSGRTDARDPGGAGRLWQDDRARAVGRARGPARRVADRRRLRQRPHGVRRLPRLRARPHRRHRRVAPRRHDDGPQPDPLVRGPPPARGHPPLAAAGGARHRRRAPADRRHVPGRAGDVREPPAAGLPPRRRGPGRAAAAGRPSAGRAQGARDRCRDPRARRAGDRGPHRRGGLAAVDRRRVGARGPHRGLGGRHLPRDARPRTGRAGRGLDHGRVRRRRADRRLPAVRGRAPDRRRRHDHPDPVRHPRAARAACGRGRHGASRRRRPPRGARGAEPVHPGGGPRWALVPLPQAAPRLPPRRARATRAGHDRHAPPLGGDVGRGRGRDRAGDPPRPRRGRPGGRGAARRDARGRGVPGRRPRDAGALAGRVRHRGLRGPAAARAARDVGVRDHRPGG